MRMDPFSYIQNRINQIRREFDRDFAPFMQRFNNPALEQNQNIPMIGSAPQSALENYGSAPQNSLENFPFGGMIQSQPTSWFPSIRMDVRETPQEVLVVADLPGVSKENIKASVDEDGFLLLRAEKREEKTENEPSGQWSWRERHSGVIQRSIQLPRSIDPSKAAQAEFKDGVLQLKFNKKPEKQGKLIEIQ